MYLSESLQKKWEAVLDHPELPKIADPYRKAVTAVVLENQAAEMIKSGQMLYEATPADRKSTRLNSSHSQQSRMPSSA